MCGSSRSSGNDKAPRAAGQLSLTRKDYGMKKRLTPAMVVASVLHIAVDGKGQF
jgi:hypothetical protein